MPPPPKSTRRVANRRSLRSTNNNTTTTTNNTGGGGVAAVTEVFPPMVDKNKTDDDEDTENVNYTISKSSRQFNSPHMVLGESNSQSNINTSSSSVSQRRLQYQQRSAIFKQGKSPKPSKVNVMLEKQRNGSGSSNKEMILTECHRVGSNDRIEVPQDFVITGGKSISRSRKKQITPSPHDSSSKRSIINQNQSPVDIVNKEESKVEDTNVVDVNNIVADSPSNLDFKSRMAWAARLESKHRVSLNASKKSMKGIAVANDDDVKKAVSVKNKTEVSNTPATKGRDDSIKKQKRRSIDPPEKGSVVKEVEKEDDVSSKEVDFTTRRQLWAKKSSSISSSRRYVSSSSSINKKSSYQTLNDDEEEKKETDKEPAWLKLSKRRQLLEKRRQSPIAVSKKGKVPVDEVEDEKNEVVNQHSPQRSTSPVTSKSKDTNDELSTPRTRLLQQEKHLLSIEKEKQAYIGKEVHEEKQYEAKELNSFGNVVDQADENKVSEDKHITTSFESKWSTPTADSDRIDDKELSVDDDEFEPSTTMEDQEYVSNTFSSNVFGDKEQDTDTNAEEDTNTNVEEGIPTKWVEQSFGQEEHAKEEPIQVIAPQLKITDINTFQDSLSIEQLAFFQEVVVTFDAKIIKLRQDNKSKTTELDIVKKHNQQLLDEKEEEESVILVDYIKDYQEEEESPVKEGIVDSLNRKIADLHTQLEASEAVVRHLENQKKKSFKKLGKGMMKKFIS